MSTHTPDAIQRHAIISSVLIDRLSSPHAILRGRERTYAGVRSSVAREQTNGELLRRG